jgi:PAS domain S-box-containing protein
MQSQTHSEPLRMPMSLPAGGDSSRGNHRLLIVDDDHDVRRALMEVLTISGYECDQASSVPEALLYLEQQTYACILTDLIMPEKSGLDLLRDVVASRPDVAVILVSGQNDTAQVRRALKSGAYDYLVKPSTAAEIVATVDAALKKRQQFLKEQTDRQSLRERVEIGMVESILFEDIVRSTIDGIMITDLENRIIMVNPAYERLTGFQRQELMGTIPKILKGNRSSTDFGRRVAYELSSSGYWSGEVIDERKDGTEWYANLTISRVKRIWNSS